MNIKRIGLFAILLLTLSSHTTAVEEEPNYSDPRDLNREDWNEINGKLRVYNDCLGQEMMKWVSQGTDPRDVSNQVLEICSSHLLELQDQMNAKNLDPNYTERFIYANKNRAARQMLGAIMMLMSQQQQMNQNDNTDNSETDSNQQ